MPEEQPKPEPTPVDAAVTDNPHSPHGREAAAPRPRSGDDVSDEAWVAGVMASLGSLAKSDPPNAPSARKDQVDMVLKAAEYVENRVQFESAWIGQRMTWLVVSQSFLFSAFVGTLNLANNFSNVNTLARQFLAWAIPSLGLVQAIAAYTSICSAKAVNRVLSRERGRMHRLLREVVPGLTGFPLLGAYNRENAAEHTYRLGAAASHVIPQSLVVTWTCVVCSLILGPVWPTAGGRAAAAACGLLILAPLTVQWIVAWWNRRRPEGTPAFAPLPVLIGMLLVVTATLLTAAAGRRWPEQFPRLPGYRSPEPASRPAATEPPTTTTQPATTQPATGPAASGTDSPADAGRSRNWPDRHPAAYNGRRADRTTACAEARVCGEAGTGRCGRGSSSCWPAC